MKALRAIWSAFRRFGMLVGRIVTIVALTLVYALVAVPLGLLLKLLGKAPLPVRGHDSTTWRQRDRLPESMEEAELPY